MKIIEKIIFALIVIVLMVMVYSLAFSGSTPQKQASLKSIPDGSAYTSTTTKQFNGTALPTISTFKPYSGVLGSVVIEGATAGQQINIYDATTSDSTKRNNTATTTLVTIPSTTLAGTYTFDLSFAYGLLVEVIGATGTSTITWR